jgi:hypothetical protein
MMTVAEFGPGSPPNNRRVVKLKAESVCQDTAGLCEVELFNSCHGGDDVENGVDNERLMRSLETGAEVYENVFVGSVLPP